GDARQRADLQQHVLVEDAAAQRLGGHGADVWRHPGQHEHGQHGGHPVDYRRGQQPGGSGGDRGQAGAMMPSAPRAARQRPAGRKMAYPTGIITATTEAGTSTDQTPASSAISPIAVSEAVTAANSRSPSRTRSASSSSNGRSLRGSYS